MTCHISPPQTCAMWADSGVQNDSKRSMTRDKDPYLGHLLYVLWPKSEHVPCQRHEDLIARHREVESTG